MGSNIIEDDSETTTQQLRDKVIRKDKRDNCPENFNVIRDKTYNQPLVRATHRYPTRNIIHPTKNSRRTEGGAKYH